VSSRVLGISNDDAHFDSHCVTNPATLYPLGDSKGVMVLTTQCHTGSDYRISYCLWLEVLKNRHTNRPYDFPVWKHSFSAGFSLLFFFVLTVFGVYLPDLLADVGVGDRPSSYYARGEHVCCSWHMRGFRGDGIKRVAKNDATMAEVKRTELLRMRTLTSILWKWLLSIDRLLVRASVSYLLVMRINIFQSCLHRLSIQDRGIIVPVGYCTLERVTKM